MFLPDELETAFVGAKLKGHELVEAPVEILNRENVKAGYPIFNHWTLGIILALLSFIIWLRSRRIVRINFGRRLLIFIVGLGGMLALLLWVATDHQATKPNWDVLWLFPLNAFIWPFLKNQAKLWQLYYFKGLLLLLVISAVFVGLGQFPLYYLPYIFALVFLYMPFAGIAKA